MNGQYSEDFKTKLKGAKTYNKAKHEWDIVKMFQLVKRFSCQQQHIENMAIMDTMKRVSLFFKSKDQSNNDYHQDFAGKVKDIKSFITVWTISHVPAEIKA